MTKKTGDELRQENYELKKKVETLREGRDEWLAGCRRRDAEVRELKLAAQARIGQMAALKDQVEEQRQQLTLQRDAGDSGQAIASVLADACRDVQYWKDVAEARGELLAAKEDNSSGGCDTPKEPPAPAKERRVRSIGVDEIDIRRHVSGEVSEELWAWICAVEEAINILVAEANRNREAAI